VRSAAATKPFATKQLVSAAQHAIETTHEPS
jgi:hypothetical protein